MSTAIEFEHVVKEFRRKKTVNRAVDDVTLTIEEGEIFGVIGYSGAGKSTLVRLVNQLETPTSGTVRVNGRDLATLSGRDVRRLRAGIGMIFQQFNLLHSRTVAGNVEYPLRLAGVPASERRARVAELLDFVGIADKAKSYPDQLSGGQKQRVGIARALATKPAILLADEATSALDPETTEDVLRLLARINDELGVTIVVITHEMHVVRAIADRVAVMEKGRIVEEGRVYDVFSHPQAETTRRFLSTVLSEVPDESVLAVLKQRYPGRLFVIDVRDDGGTTGLLSTEAAEFGVSVAVVYGGISELQGRPFGTLTVEVTGEPDAVERFSRRLAERTKSREVQR